MSGANVAFLFPGQGAQYPGMAKDFYKYYPIARQTFEEANDILQRKLSDIIFNGPETVLTETRNSQLAIYVSSVAILRVLQALFPELKPGACAGLSLGEYTALTAAGKLSFSDGVPLVNMRGQFMNDACNASAGTMAVIIGLDSSTVREIVAAVNMPNDLWAANFNCPGQVVISGTLKGIEAGTAAAKDHGAKRVLPLQVHGAFHSGLMKLAEEKLVPHIQQVSLANTPCPVVMNVTGASTNEISIIRDDLTKQVTHPVLWEQGIRSLIQDGYRLFVEIGCGKVLSGFNKRIDPKVTTFSLEKVEELPQLEVSQFFEENYREKQTPA